MKIHKAVEFSLLGPRSKLIICRVHQMNLNAAVSLQSVPGVQAYFTPARRHSELDEALILEV